MGGFWDCSWGPELSIDGYLRYYYRRLLVITNDRMELGLQVSRNW